MRFLAELRRRWWLVLAALIIVLLLISSRVATFYTDVLWFDSLGYVHVLWTLLTTRIGIGVVVGLAMAVLLGGNLLVAKRLAPTYRIPSPEEESVERYREALEPFAKPVLIALALLVGLLSGLAMVSEWDAYLLWANAAEFGRADPHFGRDIGFFVFVLPFHTLVNSWLFTSLAIVTVLTAIAHYVFGGIRPQVAGRRITPQTSVHLSLLLAALVAVRAWGFWLDRYMLSFSERGTVTGLSYTDINAQLVAYQLLAVIAVVCVGLFLANIWFRGWLLPSAGVGILVVAAIVLAGIYPAIIQRLQVDPQELQREQAFIERNLETTRFAFGLDNVTFESFPANSQLSGEQIVDNRTTLESIRLWDPATLHNTYRQLQVLRPYYDFNDVDVDRYTLDGDLQQAMLSVREVSPRDLPTGAQTWQNTRLVYTHGFGLVASNVSIAREDGQPVFFARDIPPQGVDEFTLDNPRVYFGEDTPEYSLVGTTERELDYPLQGGGQETYEYTGEDGVVVGTAMRRLAFALRYAEPNFVLSDLILRDSRILFNRDIRERVEAVAPYLKFDHDPYPVAVNERIKWILDGYTTTDMIPYSERVDLADLTLAEQRQLVPVPTQDGGIQLVERSVRLPGLSGDANYIRNSVKAVVDAYDGSVTLYVVEPDDPLIQVWQRIFPESFTPGEEAGDALARHFRYPEDMFRVQASLFETYHIGEAEEFYTKEDAWSIPNDAAFAANQEDVGGRQASERPMRPYYLLMRLPGQDEEEFALIQPFTPEERPNLIAWLAGRSDGEHYGQLKAFVMPPDRTVFGPGQIQARVNQEENIARQISLWNQSESRVIYGNLLVIPIEDSLLYAQPLFLRAERGDIPELRKVVLIFGDRVLMEDSLAESLASMFGAVPELRLPEGVDEEELEQVPTAPDGEPVEGEFDPRVAQLIREAIGRFTEAEDALREGELGRYQELTREAEELLREAQDLMDGPGAAEPEAPEDGAPEEGENGAPDGGEGGAEANGEVEGETAGAEAGEG